MSEDDQSTHDDLWGDPDDDSDEAFLERLRVVRRYLSRLMGDCDAAVGFTRAAEAALPAALGALDAAIAAEEEYYGDVRGGGDEGEDDEEPEPPPPRLVQRSHDPARR
jgi:hypothetical protein